MYVHVCMYVSMYLCIYVSMYLCIYVSMYICIYVSMYICMCIYIYIYIHTHGLLPLLVGASLVNNCKCVSIKVFNYLLSKLIPITLQQMVISMF